MVAVLDAWAVMAVLLDEPAARRVRDVIVQHDARISSINLGEAYYIVQRKRGRRVATEQIDRVRALVHVEDPDWPLAHAAAEIKAGGGLSYPDAFCVATAMRHRAPLYTGDPEIIGLGADIEVIDLRSTA
ncbi:type II toxin-antitoxin system VapC family toxin [Conexibacter woesei]|uniref:Ribonuclease VapC n=1 Tax=Conexibacter woesei (strain DSM 14684 / CCUG 47730 / CIP 108061 / JCM 11494 / NBRC 100937 / ID131577) TaxID=469383 RepID=D3F1I6_CONWI|nr:type II toxin-antitoxin system VapC family toxin [Conexibacter woesei]ADB52149.1 PilT protein domain protein [Conexibacter woesei DSM 14684]